jgi:hypothetical protein
MRGKKAAIDMTPDAQEMSSQARQLAAFDERRARGLVVSVIGS